MNRDTAMHEFLVRQLVQPRGQLEPALESTVWNFEPPDRRATQFFRPRAIARDPQHPASEAHLDLIGRHARKGDQQRQPGVGFEEIDRRLPGGTGGRFRSLKELPLQSFRPIEQFERFGPHEATVTHSGPARSVKS